MPMAGNLLARAPCFAQCGTTPCVSIAVGQALLHFLRGSKCRNMHQERLTCECRLAALWAPRAVVPPAVPGWYRHTAVPRFLAFVEGLRSFPAGSRGFRCRRTKAQHTNLCEHLQRSTFAAEGTRDPGQIFSDDSAAVVTSRARAEVGSSAVSGDGNPLHRL